MHWDATRRCYVQKGSPVAVTALVAAPAAPPSAPPATPPAGHWALASAHYRQDLLSSSPPPPPQYARTLSQCSFDDQLGRLSAQSNAWPSDLTGVASAAEHHDLGSSDRIHSQQQPSFPSHYGLPAYPGPSPTAAALTPSLSNLSEPPQSASVSVAPSSCGAQCCRDKCPRRAALPEWILHCATCAASRASLNFHLCEECFLEKRDGLFIIDSMSALVYPGGDGSEAAIADHVRKHKFTRIYNKYRTNRLDWTPELLPPLLDQSLAPAFSTSDACAHLVTKLFKVGCVINDLAGCLDLGRWKVLQHRLDPNYFDMSVFYHQAGEHEYLALLFWLRSNILDGGEKCIGMEFLDASGLAFLQHMRCYTDMARLLFRSWSANICTREPGSQVNLSNFNFGLIRDLILALNYAPLRGYFARDCFTHVFNGFTCGPRPTRFFRELNDRLRQIIDREVVTPADAAGVRPGPQWLHELLLMAFHQVSERIEPGSSLSGDGIARAVGRYLDVVFWVGRELQEFWFMRTCRHTMSALAFDVLREYNAVDGQLPPRSGDVQGAECELVVLMFEAYCQLNPREAISSEDHNVIADTIKSVTAGNNLRRFVRALGAVRSETKASRRLRQLVNLLVFTWRGIDNNGLTRALSSLDDPRCFSSVLAPYVDWSPLKHHMMEITSMMRGTERQRSITQSLLTGLRGRSVEGLRHAIQPAVPPLIVLQEVDVDKQGERGSQSRL